MNRTRFYRKVVVDDIPQLDFLDNNLSKFEPVRQTAFYRCTKIDKKRPDIISSKNYGTEYYWWVICLFNRLNNPFFDIQVAKNLEIPDAIDMMDFFKGYKIR